MEDFDLFPRQGEGIAGLSLWFQKNQIGLAGCGVLKDLDLTRNSATEIVVSSGYYSYYGVAVSYAGATLSAIPAASSGYHRYDVIVINPVSGNAERVEGTEAVPDSSSNFLENYIPLPAILTQKYFIVLGILWIDSTGIKNSTKGTYCTNGIARMRSPAPFGVDNSTILISANGVISVAPTAGVVLVDGTIPLTADWDAGSYEIRAQTFESDVATGTAPLVIASTTLVSNLNADLLDGIHGTELAKLDGTTPLTANWDVGAFQLRALTLYADVATGTAPLVIASTTLVSNLNADLLDGLEASAFLLKDGTLGLTADWDAGSYEIRAQTFESDVATGTAPLVVASTTLISNLNADLLDGLEASAFLLKDGTLGLTADWDAGSYEIRAQTFESDVATGTAPLVVASTTLISNLNADLLDGLEASAFAATSALWGLPAHYERSRMWKNKGSNSATDRGTLVSPDIMTVNINNVGYMLPSVVELDLNADSGTWDTLEGTDYSTAANRAGKDFYVYACTPISGSVPVILVSAATTYPFGYNATTSRKIGGFHCLCVAVSHATTLTQWAADTVTAVGTSVRKVGAADGYLYRCTAIAGDGKTDATTEPNWASISVGQTIVDDQVTWLKVQHILEGYEAGAILPRSVWDLKHRSAGSQAGMVWAGKTDFDSLNYAPIWVAIYLASGTGSGTTSVNGGTISDTRNWMDFVDDFAAIGCRMLEDDEFQAIASGSNEETNITGSADPGTTGGHVDTAGRRMISHIGCESCCGELWQWLRTQSYRSDGADEAAHQAWAWEDLPGTKGSMFKQGTYGDVKLLAGCAWGSGADCGSRCRAAVHYRWHAGSNIGGRFAAVPV